MGSERIAKDPRSSDDSTKRAPAKDGAWEIEMRPSASTDLAVEETDSQTRAGQALFEQTFHYLQGFLDRRYQ